MPSILSRLVLAALAIHLLLPSTSHAADDDTATIQKIVAQTIQPLMAREGVPGMAVGLVYNGQTHTCNFGVASKTSGKPVNDDTLFEVGSVSKTFTATLASHAQVEGQLSLSDLASKYLPSLRGSSFDRVTLIHLGTHKPGGLPMQVPDAIQTNDQLMRYFHDWKPPHDPGTYRTYSNLSIGLLGVITAKSLHEDFTALMEDKLLPVLGLKSTYLNVPKSRLEDYAQGYTEKDAPIRLSPDILWEETYGIRTTASDLLRFVEANMGMLDLDEKWQRAVTDTHTGYYRLGAMTQDLIWEQYHYPVSLPDLLAGNSDKIITEANPVTRLDPPSPPEDDVLINKTGSTNGFSTYMALVPQKRVGIVLLANKRFPIAARVSAALEILMRLSDDAPGTRVD